MIRSRAEHLAPVATLVCALTLGGCAADGTGAGAGAAQGLGEPTGTLAEDFGSIQTVRELDDGRVLVADPLGNALYLVDLDAETRAVIGSEGEGPEEYGQPDAVWPLPDGRTLLVDLGNARMVELGTDLSFGDTNPLTLGEPGPGGGFVLAVPQGIDRQGRVYARSMGGMGPGSPDSAAVLRVDRGTLDVDSVGQFKLQDRIREESGGPNNQNVSISPIPLSAEDAWGVAHDGAVVFARAADYSIEWVHPDGTITRGPATDFEPIPIGTAEKEEFVAGQGRSGGGLSIGMSIENGAVSMQIGRGRIPGGGGPREIDQYTWPEVKPPFYSGRIDVDPLGRAWVRRHMPAGADATYDLFDRSGELVRTVTLGHNQRVIGFGAESVYVVAFDDFDLNYLERYALPGQ